VLAVAVLADPVLVEAVRPDVDGVAFGLALCRHYTFNLRDFARVVQGMLLSSADDFEKSGDMLLLWSHEVFRVFYDRLTDEDDRLWFIEEMKKQTASHFNVEMDHLFKEFDTNKYATPRHSNCNGLAPQRCAVAEPRACEPPLAGRATSMMTTCATSCTRRTPTRRRPSASTSACATWTACRR
jgi:hypothetical protein